MTQKHTPGKTFLWITIVVVILIGALVFVNQQSKKIENQHLPEFDLVVENQPTKGDENAPVTVIELGDFKCPACSQWKKDIYPKLTPYIESGDVQFQFVNLPLLSIHGQEALNAAVIGELVYEHDPEAFWPYYENVFNNTNKTMTNAFLWELIEEHTDLDLDTLKEDFEENVQTYLDRVSDDLHAIDEAGIKHSTPTILINGQKVTQAFDFGSIEQVIEQELEKASER